MPVDESKEQELPGVGLERRWQIKPPSHSSLVVQEMFASSQKRLLSSGSGQPQSSGAVLSKSALSEPASALLGTPEPVEPPEPAEPVEPGEEQPQ